MLGPSAGFFMTIYVIRYALKTFEADFMGAEMVYLVYMYIFITCFSTMVGAISVLSSYYFI